MASKKKLPDNRLIQRISPRSKRSNWTELNKARVRRLEALGLMTTAGRAVLPEMDLISLSGTLALLRPFNKTMLSTRILERFRFCIKPSGLIRFKAIKKIPNYLTNA